MEYVTYRETLALRDQYLMSRESIIERIVFRNVLSNVHAYFVIRRTCERFIVKGNAKNLSWCTFISRMSMYGVISIASTKRIPSNWMELHDTLVRVYYFCFGLFYSTFYVDTIKKK